MFCDIYEGVYNERKLYPKGSSDNLSIKLALNSCYGKSNSVYSPLFDTLYTMKTTINGQLLLCMLSERLMEEIPDITTLQINTDGTSIKLHKQYVDKMYEICKRWEKFTGLELEYVNYSKMIISNVNNYIAVTTDGKIKRKGAAFIYKVQPGELELHKNFSMLIVPKALEAYFVNNIAVEQFIRNHTDIYDFFKRTKINKVDNLYLISNTSKKEIQRVSRYYVSGQVLFNKITKQSEIKGYGGILMKEMPPLLQKETKKMLTDYNRLVKNGYAEDYDTYKKSLIKNRQTNIEAGYLCEVVNDMSKVTEKYIRETINYQYYIDEVYKVINTIEHDR